MPVEDASGACSLFDGLHEKGYLSSVLIVNVKMSTTI